MQAKLLTPALLTLLGLVLLSHASLPQSQSASTVTLSLAEYDKVFSAVTHNEQAIKHQAKEAVLQQQADELREKLKHTRDQIINRRKNSTESTAAREEQLRMAITKGNWLLTNHSVSGKYEAGDRIPWRCTLRFEVLEESWTKIPLIGPTTVVDQVRVRIVSASDPAVLEPVKLNRDTFVLHDPDKGLSLGTNRSGTIVVDFVAFGGVQSNRNQRSVHLKTHHPIVTVDLNLVHDPGDTITELGITPAGHHTTAQHGHGTLVTVLPSRSDQLEIKWMVAASDQHEVGAVPTGAVPTGAVQSPQSTVVHHALHAVGDSVLRSTHSFTYTVTRAPNHSLTR